jgi:hypothetical protein
MMSHPEAEAVLTRLCGTARNLLDPELDAAAIEAAVMARATRPGIESRLVQKTKPGRYKWPALALAATAATCLVATTWHSRDEGSRATSERSPFTEGRALDGASLGVGQLLDASERDLIVQHSGIVVWTLRAPGRVRVVETGAKITLALDAGGIDANVVPRQQSEVFAVQVGEWQVSAHGTAFSVHRRGDMADIAVTEGSVRLDSVNRRGPSDGRLLSAPAHVSVNVGAEPELSAKAVDLVAESAKPASVAATVAAPAARDKTNRGKSALAERPSTEEIERVWDAIARELSACFATQSNTDPNLRVSFATQVSVQLSPNGSIRIVNFAPAVPELVEACANRRALQLRAQPTKFGTLISRPRVLTR